MGRGRHGGWRRKGVVAGTMGDMRVAGGGV